MLLFERAALLRKVGRTAPGIDAPRAPPIESPGRRDSIVEKSTPISPSSGAKRIRHAGHLDASSREEANESRRPHETGDPPHHPPAPAGGPVGRVVDRGRAGSVGQAQS